MLLVTKGQKTYYYSGTLEQMFSDYLIPESCVNTLSVQEFQECEVELFDLTSYPTLDLS